MSPGSGYVSNYFCIVGVTLCLSILLLRRPMASRAAEWTLVVNAGALVPVVLLIAMGLQGFAPVAQMSVGAMNLWRFWLHAFPLAMLWSACCVLASVICLLAFLASPRRWHDWREAPAPFALVVLTVIHTLFAAHFMSMQAPDC